jgi:3-oxoacyl-ACP reductase-like protein
MKDSFRRQTTSFAGKIAFAGTAAAAMVYLIRQQRRMTFKDKTVVIAGASRGLGLELARGFAKEGAHVVLLARNIRMRPGSTSNTIRIYIARTI